MKLGLLLVLVVFALYAQTARHDFVDYDTVVYLTRNEHVLGGLSLSNVGWAFTSFDAANWHPLTWLSHMLDVELFGLRPAGHMLENAAWHAANTLLVLALFTRLGLARAFAFGGALLFAVHPLRAESVAWIAERKDLLAAFFGLACLLAWLAYARSRSGWTLAAALALHACSLMSKPMLVTLPCLLLLFEFWPLCDLRPRAPRLFAVAGFGLLSLASVVVTLLAQSSSGALQGLESMPVWLRIETALDSYAWYFAHSFWPAALAFHYPIEHDGPGIARALLGAALLAGTSLLAWRLRQRIPGLLLGWLWFLGTLVPVIGIVQVGRQAHADRYSYLPSVGLLLAVFCVAERELLPRLGARVLAASLALAALALAALAWPQIGTWRDTEELARHALAVTRDNNVACELLGVHYSNAGRNAEALPLLREAVRLSPNDPDALASLGGTLIRLGENEEAEVLLLRSSRLGPDRWQCWSLLGGVYLAQQRPAQALEALDRALARETDHIGTWMNHGLALEALGRNAQALDSMQRAVALRGDTRAAELTLARLLLRLDRPEEARAHFRRVLEQDAADFDALRGLERVELARGALPEAWELAQAAARVRPESAPALADMAWIRALARTAPLADPRAALELAERALQSGSAQPALLDALAFAAAANGDFARAIAAAERALASVRGADPLWAARLEKRLTAYREQRVDRETPR